MGIENVEKLKFVKYFFNKEFSFDISSYCLKLSANVNEDHMEGSVTEMF